MSIDNRKPGIRTLCSWLCAVVVMVAIAIMVREIRLNENYMAGRIISVKTLSKGDRVLAQVREPGRETRALLMDVRSEKPTAGCWIFAWGKPVQISGDHTVLDVADAHTLPLPPGLSENQGNEIAESFPAYLRDHREMAVVLGIVVLLSGFILLRLVSGVASGLLGAVILWHATAMGEFHHLFSLPQEAWTAVLLLGFLSGTMVGFRRRSFSGNVMQRLLMILIVALFLDEMSRLFDWSAPLTRYAIVLGIVVSPCIGLWLLGACLLSMGLGAQTSAAGCLVLGVTGVIMHIVTRGDWIPEWRLDLHGWKAQTGQNLS